MSNISKETIDKLKIVSELADDNSVKQLAKIVIAYIEESSKDDEMGFKDGHK